jgi:hypothetical protein
VFVFIGNGPTRRSRVVFMFHHVASTFVITFLEYIFMRRCESENQKSRKLFIVKSRRVI